MRSFDRAARRLAKVAGTGGAFLVLGGVVSERFELGDEKWAIDQQGNAEQHEHPAQRTEKPYDNHDTLEATAA